VRKWSMGQHRRMRQPGTELPCMLGPMSHVFVMDFYERTPLAVLSVNYPAHLFSCATFASIQGTERPRPLGVGELKLLETACF
jgi:hypothetical protein